MISRNIKHRPFIFYFSFCFYATISQTQGPLSGATFANVAIVGSTSTWANVGNTAVSDNTYVTNTSALPSNGNFTDYLQVTNFGFSIPAGSTIDGITVEVERVDAGSRAKDKFTRIVKGGVIGATDESNPSIWPGTDTYVVHGGPTDLWGETWTEADINSASFGVAISAFRSGGGAAIAAPQIDHIRVTVAYTNTLPVELLSFSVQHKHNVINLNWATASEKNNDHYEVERSKNGIDFQKITSVPSTAPNGNSHSKIEYSTIDDSRLIGVSYYRLKQVDKNGTFTHSPIITVERVKDKNIRFSIQPNPNNGEFMFDISGLENAHEASINLKDESGKQVYSSSFYTENSGSASMKIIPDNVLSPGIYFCTISVEGIHYSAKVIVN